MNSYEGVFIFLPESTPEVRKKQIKGLEDLIHKLQGILGEKIEWGKKLLGYPVKKFREGFFILLSFQLDPSKMAEFRNALELQEELLKFMVTRKSTKVKKPTVEKSRPPVAKPAHQVGSSQ